MEVNHSQGKFLCNGRLLDCNVGESLNSLETWGKLFGNWSTKRVRTFFGMLKKEQMIVTESVTVSTRLRVCNYSDYQIEGQPEGTTKGNQRAQQRATGGHTNKNVKNEENEKNEKNFDLFWQIYPKKKNKKKSKQMFLKLLKSKDFNFDFAISQLKKQISHIDWIKDNGQWVPLPTTWLFNEKWNDEIKEDFTSKPQTKTDDKQALFDKWNREIAEEEANEENSSTSDAIILSRV
jgi:hypothetical protein